MKKLLGLFALAAVQTAAMAQDATVKDLKAAATTTVATDTSIKANKHGWVKGGLFNLNLTQISNSNWIAAGGDKFSLSFAASVNAFATKNWGRNT